MEATKDWPSILQFETGATITEAEVEKRYRMVAKKAHPDAGGSNEAMTQVNLAKQLALAWVAKERARVQARRIAERQAINQQGYANAFQASNNTFGMANSFTQQGAQAWGGGLGSIQQDAIRQSKSKAEWVRDFFRASK